MILIGRYLSPFSRRCAVTLHHYGIPYEHRPLNVIEQPDEVRVSNPLIRIPALILDDGETLVDSAVILDALDHMVPADEALTPREGPERRQIMSLVGLGTGAAEKAVIVRMERSFRPEEKIYEPWMEHCEGQTKGGIEALNQMAKMPWIAGERMTQADITAVVVLEFLDIINPALAERLNCPKLKEIAARSTDTPPFAETRPVT